MPEHTLHFETPIEIQDVLGRGAKLLPDMEAAFGVEANTRDQWVKLQADDEAAIEEATAFLEMLRRVRASGAVLRKHNKAYALDAAKEGKLAEVERLFTTQINVAAGKRPIVPRTFGQLAYIESVQDYDISFGVGPAGTGKTFLAMALATRSLLEEKVSRIILTRPAVEAGESLGFLPGDMHQKVMPYLRPLYDALYAMMSPETIQKMMDSGVIEIAPLAYMRGRTLNNAFIILDEAQNTTPEQMMMFLTRMGFDSTCVVTGDPSQIDLPNTKRSGLIEATATLRDTKGISITRLDDTDVVRHELVQKIIRAYRKQRTQHPDEVPTQGRSTARAERNDAPENTPEEDGKADSESPSDNASG